MEPENKTYYILLVISIVISLAMAIFFIYEYSRYLLPAPLVKAIIILLFALTAGVMTYDILRASEERTKHPTAANI